MFLSFYRYWLGRLTLIQLAVACLMGVLPLLFIPALPNKITCIVLGYIGLVLIQLPYYSIKFCSITLLVFLWAVYQAHTLLDLSRYAGKQLEVIGVVKSIGLADSFGRTLLSVDTVNQQSVNPFLLLLLDSHKITPAVSQTMLAGQRWQIVAKINMNHGVLNQGGFNYQRWSIAHRQVLHAKVIKKQKINDHLTLRQRLINIISTNVNQLSYYDVLLTLTFGEKKLLRDIHKQVLTKSGVAHLMVISGLHISLAALFGWYLARLIQLCLPIHWIHPYFPMLVSWLLALTYVWLSGANPPALRAGIAITLWLFIRYSNVFLLSWQILLLVVALLVISDPLMILSDSFWLSCWAVSAILFWLKWFPLPIWCRQKKWWFIRLFHLQLGLLFCLTPIQLLIFKGINIAALVTNLIAVPIVSFITVPIIFIALLFFWCEFASFICWRVADYSLKLVFRFIALFIDCWYDIQVIQLFFSILFFLLMVLFRLFWWRSHLCLLVITNLLLIFPDWKKQTLSWRVTMLDVGQSLAVVIEKNGKAILYDAGIKYGNYSMANQVIIPYLQWRGLIPEQIIISHQDRDHIGGLADLQQRYPQALIRSSALQLGLPCQRGKQWWWQGLHFMVLWPKNLVEKAKNKDSCVIKITDGRYSVLLTGDLEQQQEKELVLTFKEQLSVDLLQVPHHGSKTSSSSLFLRHVKPEIALVSAGRYNQWNLPAKKVVNRYQEQNIILHNTAYNGQLSVIFFANHKKLVTFRYHIFSRWYNQIFG